MRLTKPVPLVLALLLLTIWVALAGEVNVAQIAFGAVLSILLLLAIRRLRPVRPRVRRLHLAIPLAAIVLLDIVRSNIAVACIVLGLVRSREIRSGFIDIPLDLTDPHGLTILSVIVTSTPGTSWAGLSCDGRTLKLHVLDLRDESESIHFIKQRYERPLVRMFQ
jgi:multicomponent K+:H+ antiporter subunit E